MVSDATVDLFAVKDSIINGYASCEWIYDENRPKTNHLVSILSTTVTKHPIMHVSLSQRPIVKPDRFNDINPQVLSDTDYGSFNDGIYLDSFILKSNPKDLPSMKDVNINVYIEFCYDKFDGDGLTSRFKAFAPGNAYISIHERTSMILHQMLELMKHHKYDIFIWRIIVDNTGFCRFIHDTGVSYTHDHVFIYDEVPLLDPPSKLVNRVRSEQMLNEIMNEIKRRQNRYREFINRFNAKSIYSKRGLKTLIGDHNKHLFKTIVSKYVPGNCKTSIPKSFKIMRFPDTIGSFIYDEMLYLETSRAKIAVQIEHSEGMGNHKSNIIEFVNRCLVTNTRVNNVEDLLKKIYDELGYSKKANGKYAVKSCGGILTKQMKLYRSFGVYADLIDDSKFV